ncbi:MAG: nitroreductase family deazaflavin-dependent oxidoreductase [Pseudomonadales bacterium]|nr:nitroreductase family deazaflavin-dependent oxidoreductase [Pseudomonadales bacterium]
MSDDNPNLPAWIRDHLRRYLESSGADGHIWKGVPTLLPTTLWRRSGSWQTLPLDYGEYARTATGGERRRLCAQLRTIWPRYDDCQAATAREIPVVVLERG